MTSGNYMQLIRNQFKTVTGSDFTAKQSMKHGLEQGNREAEVLPSRGVAKYMTEVI